MPTNAVIGNSTSWFVVYRSRRFNMPPVATPASLSSSHGTLASALSMPTKASPVTAASKSFGSWLMPHDLELGPKEHLTNAAQDRCLSRTLFADHGQNRPRREELGEEHGVEPARKQEPQLHRRVPVRAET